MGIGSGQERRQGIRAACAFLVGGLALGCSRGGGGGSGAEAVAIIGASGGVIEVTGANSPLLGVRLEIPAGALSADLEFVIRVASQHPPVRADELEALAYIEIEPEGTVFLVPASLTLPYRDQDVDGYVDETAASTLLLVPVTASSASGTWEYPESFENDETASVLRMPIEHLSLFGLRFANQLHGPEVRVFADGSTGNLSPDDQLKAKNTMFAAIASGLWAPELACLGWSVVEASSASDADVVVRWGSIPQPPPPAVVLAKNPPPAAGDPWEITCAEELFATIGWNVDPTLPTAPGRLCDLQYVVMHEFAHALGLPGGLHLDGRTLPDGNCVPVAWNASALVSSSVAPGTQAPPTLDAFDHAFFLLAYPVVFSAAQPMGNIQSSSSPVEVSFTVVSTCSEATLDPGMLLVRVLDGRGTSSTFREGPLMSVTLAPDQKSASVVIPAVGPLGLGSGSVTAFAGDTCGPPARLGGARWEFTVGTIPSAQFQASPRSGRAPLTVSFSDRSSGTRDSWIWDFGDGGTSIEASPVHVYSTPGSYDVSLTVSGPFGSDTETKSAYVTVSEPQPPSPQCDVGVDLVVTLQNGGENLHVAWCTASEVISAGGRFWTLQAQTGGFCGWQTLFQAEERTFQDTFVNGLGSSFCLRVVVTAEEPTDPDCISGILAQDRDGPGCN